MDIYGPGQMNPVWNRGGRGGLEVCGFAIRGDFLCGFSVFPKF